MSYSLRPTQPGEACINCGHFACICIVRVRHSKTCRFRISATSSIGIECEHGYDVCPKCDPCDCGAGIHSADMVGMGITDSTLPNTAIVVACGATGDSASINKAVRQILRWVAS